MDECDVCGGPLMAIGSLGPVLHLRCRNCGLSFQREPADDAIEPYSDAEYGGL